MVQKWSCYEWRGKKQALSGPEALSSQVCRSVFLLFLPWISPLSRNYLKFSVSFSVTFNVLISDFGKIPIMYKHDFSYCKLLNKIKLISAWLLGILICLCSVPSCGLLFPYIRHTTWRVSRRTLNLSCETVVTRDHSLAFVQDLVVSKNLCHSAKTEEVPGKPAKVGHPDIYYSKLSGFVFQKIWFSVWVNIALSISNRVSVL